MRAIHTCSATMRCTDCGHTIHLPERPVADLSLFLKECRVMTDTCTKVARTCPYAAQQPEVPEVQGPPAPTESMLQKAKKAMGLS